MTMTRFFIFLFSTCLSVKGFAQELSISYKSNPAYFPLVQNKKAATIYFDADDFKVVAIAAKALQEDVFDITGQMPKLSSSSNLSSLPVIAGTIGHSKWIDSLITKKKISVDAIKGKWEAFSIEVVEHPFATTKQALVIVGADRRGTAYGIFELSRRLGVSPWKWWADVPPQKKGSVYVSNGKIIQHSPSVKYRGIFLNDEDWGLQPWAAKNMDKDIADIGPNTYAKVFELLLRLKANFIWPAMHPSTRAFYYYKNNPKVADDYAIVVGSSHAEPMLRNNVFEWAENFENEYGRKAGEWRYDTNGADILQYWKDRVDGSKNYESVYTVGMRGIHDGAMPGPKAIPEKVQLLQKVITDQRNLFATAFTKPVTTVPQIFCPYKEVLDIYRSGLQLPDDVTIVWADDNHGYIRQLSNEKEQQRSGSSGIYYHLSYWGSPHDYLWLSSVSPSLISYEMTKAYQYGADRLWVFNVGDIKPAEMELQFAMDLAWNVDRWKPEDAFKYTEQWAAETFGKKYASQIAQIKSRYYQLAAAGKPEHLGMLTFTGEEATERLKAYRKIAADAEALKTKIPSPLQDAYFELIYYPVVCARLMNEKVLGAQKSLDVNMPADSAKYYATLSTKAFEQIQQLTDEYNTKIAGGKWNGMMSWHPRDLPVFKMPKVAGENYLDSVKQVTKQRPQPITKTTIDISRFINKHEISNVHFKLVEGLGISGKAIATAPFRYKIDSVNKAPFLDYKLNLSLGSHTVIIKCLPTQSIDGDKKLMYGISFNNGPIQSMNIHAESESRQWKENVLRGFTENKIVVNAGKGENSLRIYFPDPGLALTSIEVE